MNRTMNIANHTTEDGHLAIGPEQHGKRIILVNPENRHYTRYRGDSDRGSLFILHFGAYGWTRLAIWEDHLQDALDTAVDWIRENTPGLLCNDSVQEEYNTAIAEGCSEQEAIERAEVDTTIAGNYGDYIPSWEWGILAENPSRETLAQLCEGNYELPLPRLLYQCERVRP